MPARALGRPALPSYAMRALLAWRGAAGSAESSTGQPVPAEVEGQLDRITVWTRAAAAVAALGLVGVVVFGALWWLADHGPAAQTAAARDEAVAAARQIAVDLQSLDTDTVDKGLDAWQASATGPLLEEFTNGRQQYAEQMRQTRTNTTARVVELALADFNPDAGTARAIAAMDVKTTQDINGTTSLPVTRQVRIQLDLVRMPDAGWKAAAASAIQPTSP
jgi:Mce-associated membrane protein